MCAQKIPECGSDCPTWGRSLDLAIPPNVVDERIAGATVVSMLHSTQDFLFPLALKIPGSLRILDR
eukprot:4696380-Lingulodinium_polyedra.AAC.1